MGIVSTSYVGRSVERVEDAALLSGLGRYIDDLGMRPGTLHAAILRSPHAHADILGFDVQAAKALPGVTAVVTGRDLDAVTTGLVPALRAVVDARAIAVDRVRYVGEPVAIVVARDRYLAEDGCDLIEVQYRVRPAVVDPLAALAPDSEILHEGVGANCVSDRRFRYGDPEAAFAESPRSLSVTVRYPRNTGSPMETYGVVASYDPTDDSYDVLANFQGPFSIHAVVARALKVPGNRLRLRTPPDSGGSFGVKQGVAPYAVLIAATARLVGQPVKWIEDRLEHLSASVSATNRVTTLRAAFEADGRVTALDWDQIEDCGAYLRAPEPATLYRMHGNLTGAYAIRNVAVRNRVVLTNKTPTGLVRGFGGPQVYYPLERLMQRIALTLGLEPFAVIRRNLIPADAFPYRTATGALYDSGDYQRALDEAARDGGLDELKRRRDAARAEGRLYGIGLTAAVEPSVSNMGYITTVLTAEERAKAGPKNGAQSTATITLDPVGSVTVQVASVPQGQGHRTVLAQVVADVLGLPMEQVRVTADLDTAKDAWSIASGNYASRFAAAVAGVAHLAATRLRDRLARIAAAQLNLRPEDLVFAGGRIASRVNPDAGLPFARVAATSHWSPGLVPEELGAVIRETVFWTPPELTAPDAEDHINSSLCHGFIFDICGLEIDRVTGKIAIDRYVSMHDCGRILHPGMVEGQVRGGFAQALGAAVYEELAYGDDGAFLSGTFADYLLPTATEVPDLRILHVESPSPFTLLGAKGVGEGNCMSTPVCLANAVADALGLEAIDLPLTPAKLAALAAGGEERGPPSGHAAPKPAAKAGDRTLRGEGSAAVTAPPETVWAMLLDPDVLASVIPGSHGVRKLSDTRFQADVTLGVGPVKGRYKAEVILSDLDEPRAVTLTGTVTGGLGSGGGTGRLTLEPDGTGGTRIAYVYEAAVGGKVAAVGGRLLDGAARVIIGGFFTALARRAGGSGVRGRRLPAALRWLLARLGVSA
ncbi:Carbon-monoxide dehydrogenase (acceptor) [Methylobacterium radiotolerans JCM 2831]|uniref:Carbon-monoxide dehydrogenase (Acceptor) n=1 Tax=Methylobacterium radiotolerans (strain ATCC 27329 / DSM 1819 / JCM 2831 / NBRC 15690 / NCIMB 10815 / 0-1) TaxID=426355 RepID=B1M725_METRJ|nr:molybdopterin cofactor-binding domain-containing protein [Methylobacterium radiotolerans]ACB26684.1 Carbon-monoxide dehydrogenase (acceptor) [Methylobacterium radiotolerans JCM 2831]GEM96554.1 carbon monoxide dehydrogenase [Methylobacterium radiotolerans]